MLNEVQDRRRRSQASKKKLISLIASDCNGDWSVTFEGQVNAVPSLWHSKQGFDRRGSVLPGKGRAQA